MSVNEQIQPYVRYTAGAGIHLRRPFASDYETRRHPPICGGDSLQPFVVVAEGEALPDKFPLEAYCLRCLAIHTGKSVDELVGDWEQPILG